MWWSGVVAFAGLACQAIIPIQDDLLPALLHGDDMPAVTVTSTIHQMSAAVFFMASIGHVVTYLQMSHATRVAPLRSYWSWMCKAACGMFTVLPLFGAFAKHPGSGVQVTGLHQLQDAGRSQWICVGALICFYCSYTVEFCLIAAQQARRAV